MTRVRIDLRWPAENTVHIGEDLYFVLERHGRIYLLGSRCPHRGGPLHLGRSDGERLRCPWHGSRFSLDRLCSRALPAIRHGSHVIAYVPTESQVRPAAGHQLVFAK